MPQIRRKSATTNYTTSDDVSTTRRRAYMPAPDTDPIFEEEYTTRTTQPRKKASNPHTTTNIVIPPPPQMATRPKSARQIHTSVFIGLGMLVALLLVMTTQQITGTVNTWLDDWHYGRPRTFQTDAFVGHETGQTPSHFIALNRNGRIEIIEFPGGDANKARIFIGPQLAGTNAALEPVTLSFDYSRNSKLPDMIVSTRSLQVTFRNDQGTFKAT